MHSQFTPDKNFTSTELVHICCYHFHSSSGKVIKGPRAIQKAKNICTYSLHTCFVAAEHCLLAFNVMLKICLMQLYDKCLNVKGDYVKK